MLPYVRTAAVVLLGVVITGACGGSSFSTEGDATNNSGSNSGNNSGDSGGNTTGSVDAGDSGGSNTGSNTGSNNNTSNNSTSNNGGVDCSLVDCALIDCQPGTKSIVLAGDCCPTCVPIAQCNDTPQSCTVLKGCVDGYERVEWAPGCCACQPDACADVNCDPPDCGPGDELRWPEGSCCAVCAPKDDGCDASQTPCDAYVCPSGYIASPGGECCSDCVADPNACKDEAASYQEYLASVIEELGAKSCEVPADCTVVNLSNKCEGQCGTVVAKENTEQLLALVKNYGDQNCAHCPDQLVACPAIEIIPDCVEGMCR